MKAVMINAGISGAGVAIVAAYVRCKFAVENVLAHSANANVERTRIAVIAIARHVIAHSVAARINGASVSIITTYYRNEMCNSYTVASVFIYNHRVGYYRRGFSKTNSIYH